MLLQIVHRIIFWLFCCGETTLYELNVYVNNGSSQTESSAEDALAHWGFLIGQEVNFLVVRRE